MTTRHVTSVPNQSDTPGWYGILPPPPPPQPLATHIEADWAIIGAGYAGLSAAARLADHRPNERVVILEAQPIAWGSCGRNSGFMIDLPHDMASDAYSGGKQADLRNIRMQRTAIDFATGLVERHNLHDHFKRCGKHHGAGGSRGVRVMDDFCRNLDSLDEPWTPLDRTQMQALTGTDYYLAGMHAPGCAQMQPVGYIRGLVAGLAPQTTVYENSPVLQIDSAGSAHTLHTANGTLTAPRLILAMNGHAQSFGFFRRRLMHLFTYGSMTRALTDAEQRTLGGQPEWGLIPADPLGATVRRHAGRLVVRNTFTYNPSITASAAAIARIGRRHDLSFAKRFPMLDGVSMQYRWGGALCLTLNSVPAFGKIGDRLYSAVCQNGQGISKGTYSGMAVADVACGVDTEIAREMSSYDPPKKLYPEPFMTIAAKTALWWKQQRVGADM